MASLEQMKTNMDLQKLLIDVCKRARLNKIPRLTVCKWTVAQTRLNKIRIGRRLSSHLTEEEMEGVIAHEVYHANKLMKYILITIAVEILIVIIVFVVELVGFLTIAREFPMLISYVPVTAFQAIVAISIPLLCLELQRFRSKTNEVRADRFAASIVGRRTFTNALKKVSSIPSEPRLRSRIWEWLNPHPSLNKRLEAIRNVKRLPSRATGRVSVRCT